MKKNDVMVDQAGAPTGTSDRSSWLIMVAVIALTLFYYWARADTIGVRSAGRGWYALAGAPLGPALQAVVVIPPDVDPDLGIPQVRGIRLHVQDRYRVRVRIERIDELRPGDCGDRVVLVVQEVDSLL